MPCLSIGYSYSPCINRLLSLWDILVVLTGTLKDRRHLRVGRHIDLIGLTEKMRILLDVAAFLPLVARSYW